MEMLYGTLPSVMRCGYGFFLRRKQNVIRWEKVQINNLYEVEKILGLGRSRDNRKILFIELFNKSANDLLLQTDLSNFWIKKNTISDSW